MISAQELRNILQYDQETGVFTWMKKISYKAVIGNMAGSINKDGYRVISIFGRKYYGHRLAYLYMEGEWPDDLIDHINLDPSDNRWKNIRPANKSQNAANTSKSSGNSTGFKGVSLHAKAGKFQSHIYVNGKSKYLGLFDSPEDAHAAYQAASNNNFKSFARSA